MKFACIFLHFGEIFGVSYFGTPLHLHVFHSISGVGSLRRYVRVSQHICLFLHFFSSTPPVALIIHSLRPRISVYTLSEAYFGEGVRQNPSSMGRVTPKGIYAIRMVIGCE